MGDPLRDQRPPRDLAERHQVVEISDEIGSFERLAEVVRVDLSALESGKIPANWRKSKVSGVLKFGFTGDEGTIASLDVRLKANVPATCQRCLRAFDLPLTTSVALMFSGSDEVLAEQEGFEIWELADETVSPIDIADEVLVMAMPLSAMHEDSDDCIAIAASDVRQETTTPFANLREQMDKGT